MAPLEFGYGDTPHTENLLPIGQVYTHMANVRHLYGKVAPEVSALGRYLQGSCRTRTTPTPGSSTPSC